MFKCMCVCTHKWFVSSSDTTIETKLTSTPRRGQGLKQLLHLLTPEGQERTIWGEPCSSLGDCSSKIGGMSPCLLMTLAPPPHCMGRPLMCSWRWVERPTILSVALPTALPPTALSRLSISVLPDLCLIITTSQCLQGRKNPNPFLSTLVSAGIDLDLLVMVQTHTLTFTKWSSHRSCLDKPWFSQPTWC